MTVGHYTERLARRLQRALGQLHDGLLVDRVIVTGVTASASMRHSVEGGISAGFRPIVVREAVGDRIAGAVEWNLFDIDANFGDVEP